jgi:hypothetical protein
LSAAIKNQQALRAYPWQHLTHIYDFVALPDLVHAADVVASKRVV